jgi:NADH dehydrogenase FAD-containing subunit
MPIELQRALCTRILRPVALLRKGDVIIGAGGTELWAVKAVVSKEDTSVMVLLVDDVKITYSSNDLVRVTEERKY